MKKRSHRVHRPERDRALFAVLRVIRGETPSTVGKRAGVSPATILNWRGEVRSGGTRFPQFYTLNRVAKAYGMEFKLQAVDDGSISASGYAGEARPH